MTKIEWTDETWQPVVGCTKVSEGCKNCYAERMAGRLAYIGRYKYQYVLDCDIGEYTGILYSARGWNGKIFCDESALDKPLHWKKPKMIFVCSMGDLFHPSVPFEFIDKVIETTHKTPQHIYQILTKRPQQMAEFFGPFDIRNLTPKENHWPYSNLWLGITAENQKAADERIPILLQIPAAKRFVSVEPMLGRMDLTAYLSPIQCPNCKHITTIDGFDVLGADGDKLFCNQCWEEIEPVCLDPLDQVIIGCESGPHRRPCKLEWVRDLVSQCKAAGVKLFIKQLDINGKVEKDITKFPKELRIRDYPLNKKT